MTAYQDAIYEMGCPSPLLAPFVTSQLNTSATANHFARCLQHSPPLLLLVRPARANDIPMFDREERPHDPLRKQHYTVLCNPRSEATTSPLVADRYRGSSRRANPMPRSLIPRLNPVRPFHLLSISISIQRRNQQPSKRLPMYPLSFPGSTSLPSIPSPSASAGYQT